MARIGGGSERRRHLAGILVFILPLLILATAGEALAESEWDKGVKAFSARDYRGALSHFRGAYMSGIFPAESCYYQALCLQQMRQPQAAKDVYTQVCKQFPQSNAARQSAIALRQMGADTGSPSVMMQASSNGPTLHEAAVPFQRTPSGHLLIPALVNGKPFTMMFDTGADMCFFKTRHLEDAGIESRAVGHTRVRGVGGEVKADIVRLSISVSGLRRTVEALVQDDRSQIRNGKDDSGSLDVPLLGETFFGDLSYEIDDASRVIRFREGHAKADSGKTSGRRSYDEYTVPYTKKGNSLLVTAKVNGRECPMILDTGCGTTCFSDKQLSALGMNRPTSADRSIDMGVGGSRSSFAFTVNSIQLGPIERNNVDVSVAINSQMEYPLLGQSFLKGLRYTVDAKDQVIKFAH